MVLAAGRGQRMRPLTDTLPKPLVKVAGRTLIDRQLDLLEAYGIERVVVNSSYLGDMLQAHLRQRACPVTIFSPEETLLETGGGIRKALPLLGEAPFFAMNSDVVLRDGALGSALNRMAAAWDDESMDILLLLHPKHKAIGFEGSGDFFLEANGHPRRRGEAQEAPYVFTGTQLLHPRLFKDTPEGAFSMNVLYDRQRSSDGVLGRVKGIIHDGDWLHVGDPEGLNLAEQYFSREVVS
jgi:MurNAc alpha-1-phosphate uridylyltransferase